MLLRDHPLMSRNDASNWPPTWTWMRGRKDKHPKGEVGILKAVLPSRIKPEDRFFVLISYQGSEYLGCLLFDNRTFCKQGRSSILLQSSNSGNRQHRSLLHIVEASVI